MEASACALMRSERHGVGSIVASRKPAKPFSDKEIAVLQTFADQAAVAIQNARLFQETQAKTRDLSEALQQQTATAEVLKVISRSAFGLSTVLKTLVDSAVRLCAADGVIYLKDGDAFLAAAASGPIQADSRRAIKRRVDPGAIR